MPSVTVCAGGPFGRWVDLDEVVDMQAQNGIGACTMGGRAQSSL